MTAAHERKQILRQSFLTVRERLSDRQERSDRIQARLLAWSALSQRETILCYVSARSEVSTHALLPQLLKAEKRVIVPFCIDDYQLGLFRLTEMGELTPGRFGILEPRIELRDSQAVSPLAIDLAILPGVAFDLYGNRLGYGKGYFDRLLARLRPDAAKCGLAFEAQIASDVPCDPHDCPMGKVVTEERLIRCGQSR